MRAIPMKNKVGDKRIRGFMWAGKGKAWTKKENYFQLESDTLVSVALVSPMGQFWIGAKAAPAR